ncbi:HisA/HisF-related TIM barrel protein [Ancylobacter sp. 6x-1]|uniref:HisA/HisF-related TIM barrel protein n=1 Tax=Ancylobacter crimeensis TaxID=2579147 RepID=A0ABT0D8L6_9HYPH|nr:HisA/HisF-related TIM barrel protein [Ancylobacter crimeensis]
MELIPVLDLMGGVVVHARRGERDRYRPIETPLCPGSDPFAIAEALLALAPFRTLYIADLDAIRGRGDHDAVIGALQRRHPGLALWVDAGEGTPERVSRRVSAGLGRPVVGTESLAGSSAARTVLAGEGTILSLDHDARGRMGPDAIHDTPALWPDDLIVMTLARVGSDAGPDIARLAEVQQKAGRRRVHAAGGVRDTSDLDRLTGQGVAGVLLASALHDGRLDPATLRRFTG